MILALVLRVWCCVVKHGLVTLVVIMILKGTATFQVLFVVSLFCAWNITTVEISSGVRLLKKFKPPSAFVYFYWSWSCKQRSWSCSGLVILVLVLRIWCCLHHWLKRSVFVQKFSQFLHLIHRFRFVLNAAVNIFFITISLLPNPVQKTP